MANDLVPGFRVVSIASPFDAVRYEVVDASAIVAGAPPLVRTAAAPWSAVLRFPAAGDAAPAVAEAFCYVVRIEAHPGSGDPVFAGSRRDGSIGDQRALVDGGDHVDLVAGQLAEWRDVLLRAGETGAFEVRVDAIRCFAVSDEGPLAMPPGVRLARMAGWSRFYGTPGDALAWRVRARRFTQLTEPTPMAWLEDLRILLVPGEQISQAIYTSGLYEPCTSIVLRELLAPGDLFVDVGANTGTLTLLAARWVGVGGRVIALEPSARELGYLRANVALNSLANVELHRLAAGRERGTAILHVADRFHAGLNTLAPAFMYDDVAEDHSERVSVITLDELLSAYEPGRIAAIKIDVEGFEPDVLAGTCDIIGRHRPALIVEVGGEALEPSHAGRLEMEELLTTHGYRFAAIEGDSGRVVPTRTMAHPAENLLAAPGDVLQRVLARAASW